MEECQPPKPSEKSGFKGKRTKGHRLSYKPKGDKKRSATWVDYKAAKDSGAAPASTQDINTIAGAPRGPKRRILPHHFKNKLVQSEAKIQAAQETIVKQQRTIVAQKKSKEIFKVMVIEARKSAREARAQAKVNVDAAKKCAYASSMKCEQIEMKMANEVNKAVDKAVMKEEEKRLRHVEFIAKRKNQQWSKVVNEKNSIIKVKQKEIEALCKIAKNNNEVAHTLLTQKHELLHIADAKLELQRAKHINHITNLKQRHTLNIAKKNEQLKQIESEMQDYIDLAYEMTDEVTESKRIAASASKKEKVLYEKSKSQLTRLQQSKDSVSELRESFDNMMEEMERKLSAALKENDSLRGQLAQQSEINDDLEMQLISAQEEIDTLTPHIIKKIGMKWDTIVTQLVVELLAHRTPPSCVAANILSVAELLVPNAKIVQQLPSLRFIRYCRTVLLHISKTLASYEIASANYFKQIFTDGTSRRQTAMQNLVVSILSDSGFRRVALSGCIISEDESAASTLQAITGTFKESGALLEYWRDVTSHLYPDRKDLLDLIPRGTELSLTKLGQRGFTMTDTCDTARKLRRLIAEEIKRVASQEGISPDEVNIRESDCWQHLRNVWFGAVAKSLNAFMCDILAEDLKELPAVYRVTLDADDLMRCVEKLFGLTANYAKGQGSEFETWMIKYHPGAYLHPIVRACGGSRQDLCVEGAPSILMNLPYYLQFTHWRMQATGSKSDAILSTKLFIMLRSSEVIAMLRVLSILHISVCLPTRWLAGNTHNLADYDFGYYDMGRALDLMETAFDGILGNGELILDEDYMMKMFDNISGSVDPFRNYLEYMFEEKLGKNISNNNDFDSKELPYDNLRHALFYPSRADIVQTHDLCCQLGEESAAAFLREFRDPSKATHNYLSSIRGKYSIAVISEDDRLASVGKEASNSIAESIHAASTYSLKTYGTIRLDSASGEGQARANNDFGRGHNAFVNHGNSNKASSSLPTRELGQFIKLPKELQVSLISAAKSGAPSLRKRHDMALAAQKAEKLWRQQLLAEKRTKNMEDSYIDAIDYFERYHSRRCWKTAEEAFRNFNSLGSESARLKAIKEQIQIRRLGFGWEAAGHQWSKDGHTYTSAALLRHFTTVVLPMETALGIPSEPPMKMNEICGQYTLGTKSDLDYRDESVTGCSIEKLKENAIKEWERRERDNETDRDASKQQNIMPKIDDSLVGFNIEYCFTYDEEDGSQYLSWVDGYVTKIINVKTRVVEIEWNKKKVIEGDATVTKQKLGIFKWNPKNPSEGAWREYFGNPYA